VNRRLETVRLTVRDLEFSYERLVGGPGHNRATYRFTDAILLIRHQGTIEAQLVEQGYALEHFVSIGARVAIAVRTHAASTANDDGSDGTSAAAAIRNRH
jgi:hypothetical protein